MISGDNQEFRHLNQSFGFHNQNFGLTYMKKLL